MDDVDGRDLAERLQTLAYGDTQALSPSATITPRTFAELDTAKPPPGVPTEPGIGALPRISLAPADLEDSPSPRDAADLELECQLGAGGMGEVYLARQRSLGREVAVKLLKADADDVLAAALVKEAVMTGHLAHPGIIPVHALGTTEDGRPVLVMKRVLGASWHELLRDPQHPAWQYWQQRAGDRLSAHLEILARICDALQFAHSAGVVHRDIKPANVLLGRFGEAYLVDWGIAIHVDEQTPHTLLGTPAYMAPEMATGGRVDARTDVYLLGATLHAVLTGRPRHTGATLQRALMQACDSEPFDYPETVPSLLAELCNRATARDPADRVQSAEAFRAALADFSRYQSSIALGEASRERLRTLRALLDREPASDEGSVVIEAYSLAAEALFGFTQALDEWADNASAERGRHDCVAAQVELHIRRKDAASAAALLRSLPDAPAELSRRVEQLEQEIASERRENERLKALDRDLDRSIGRRARLIFYLVTLGLACGASLYGYLQEGGLAALTHAQILGVMTVVTAALGLGVLFKRRELMASAINRRGTGLVLSASLLLMIHRAIAWKLTTPLQQLFITDALILCCAAVAATFWVFRWAGYIAAILLATAVVIALAPPPRAAVIFTWGTMIGVLPAAYFWRR